MSGKDYLIQTWNSKEKHGNRRSRVVQTTVRLNECLQTDARGRRPHSAASRFEWCSCDNVILVDRLQAFLFIQHFRLSLSFCKYLQTYESLLTSWTIILFQKQNGWYCKTYQRIAGLRMAEYRGN